MELNDYLASLNNTLNKKLEEINLKEKDLLNNLYNSSANIGISDSTPVAPIDNTSSLAIPYLIHDERLEDSSKSKLGTFEKLYSEIFAEETGAPISSYGFNDLDFSPLVNPLMSLLEIELNHTLYQEARRINGIDLSKYYYKNAPSKKVNIGNSIIDFGARKQMLGALLGILNEYSKELSKHIREFPSFIRMLSKAINVRNSASHDSFISKGHFMSFYESYSKLYNGNIESLILLKESFIKNSSTTNEFFTYNSIEFSYNCNIRKDEYLVALKNTLSTISVPKAEVGILMTDCEQISMKYTGDTYYGTNFREMFKSHIIPEYEKVGIKYILLDISEKSKGYIKNNKDWLGYHNALYAFCRENKIPQTTPAGLFIIGGDDVIPMPKITNPAYHEGYGIMEETLDADILYSYDETSVRIFGDNQLEIGHFLNNLNNPHFYVGRLPLENGMLVTSFDEDIIDYFKRAINSYKTGGIKIKAPLFTTCHRAQKCGKLLTKDLPIRRLPELKNSFIDNMAVSPLLMLHKDKSENIDSNIIKNMTDSETAIDNAFAEYKKAVSTSDMLIFFLHGGYNPSLPEYSGDAVLRNPESKDEERISPAAFTPNLLETENTNIKCIAAVSCYGARFINYARTDSTLLTSIHKDTLLFYGSSRIAYGPFDDSLDYLGGKLCWSLVQMREYLKNLYSGIPAGEAINRAKIKYLSTLDKLDDASKTTILEFNLFGDPLLHIEKMIDLPEDESYNTSDFVFDEKLERQYNTVYQKDSKNSNISLLDRIKGMVDRNLEGIHKQIADQLYRQHSLKPRELYTVRNFKNGYGDEGYSYCYRHADKTFDSYTFVDTDTRGIVKSIIETI